MSTSNKYKITALKRAPIEGTCVLTDDQLTSSTGSPITFPTSGGSLTTSTELAQLSSTVNDMQLGVRQAKVFDSENEMNVWLSTPANTATLAVGHAIFIRETGVPDYWWDGTRALPIEQEKVSLQGYVTTTDVQTLTNKTLTSPQITTIKNGNYTLTVPQKTSTLATTSDIPTVPDTSSFITASSTDTLTNKTLTTPVIAKIKPTSSYTITLPQKTGTMALTSDIPSISTLQTDVNTLKTEMTNLINYLKYWINNGTMNMSDIDTKVIPK